MSSISHIEIYVSDYRASVRFYDKILIPLGWKRLVCQTGHTTYSDGFLKLVLGPADPNFLKDGYHRKRVGLNHLAFSVESKTEVDRFVSGVLGPLGIPCLYGGVPTGDESYYSVFFEDPDRIKLEVVCAPGYCTPGHWTNKLEDNFDPYSAET